MADPFLGEIRIFAGNFAPQGWAMCNGQLLQIPQNTALFSLLGTMYGGNGIQTFGLPDLRGRVVIHMGQGAGLGSYVEGQTGGSENVTLSVAELPAHNHGVNASSAGATLGPAQNNYLPSNRGSGAPLYAAATNPFELMGQNMIQNTGSSQPHPNLQPYLVINYIIALQGIYPSRS